jgi:Transglycosylase SLT domain
VTGAGALFGLLGLALVGAAVGRAVGDDGPPMAWQAYRELCTHWASVWGLPALVLMAVGIVESSMRPGMSNTTDPRAVARGGSWGLFGMTQATAADLLNRHAPLQTQPAARAWNGSGASLHDPQLSAMLASFYLATLWHRFGKVLPTVAAYQQGPGPVATVLARGGNVATDLPPHGRQYVAHAQKVLSELSSRGAA